MRSHSSDHPIIIADVARGSLDDFATETAPAGRLIDITSAGLPSAAPTACLSRLEEMHAHRRRRSRLTRSASAGRAARERWSLAATRGASSAGHAAHRLAKAAGALSSRVHERLVAKAMATPKVASDPEADGVVIASLLAVVAVAYGSFLTSTWRQPMATREVAVAPVVPVAEATPPSPIRAAGPVVARRAEPVVARRAGGAMTPRTLASIWKQRDTRSLEQAFAGLRQQTLALHRCGMRVTADDRAVARCEGAGGPWTIDFQRSAGRWQIAAVSTR